jgi:hypothetical protein
MPASIPRTSFMSSSSATVRSPAPCPGGESMAPSPSSSGPAPESRLLSRGGCRGRGHSLVERNHGASIIGRADSPPPSPSSSEPARDKTAPAHLSHGRGRGAAGLIVNLGGTHRRRAALTIPTPRRDRRRRRRRRPAPPRRRRPSCLRAVWRRCRTHSRPPPQGRVRSEGVPTPRLTIDQQ